MSERVKTVFVKGEGGEPRRINADSYDEKKHGKQIDPSKVKAEGGAQPGELTGHIAATDGQRVQNTEQRVALQPPLQPAPVGSTTITEGHDNGGQDNTDNGGAKPAYLVSKKGRKHFVTDMQGGDVKGVDGIDEAGYGDEAAAWAAIMEVNNKPA